MSKKSFPVLGEYWVTMKIINQINRGNKDFSTRLMLELANALIDTDTKRGAERFDKIGANLLMEIDIAVKALE